MLHLRADNCTVQDKNRFMFFTYFSWSNEFGERHHTVRIGGNTKNSFDGAFGHLKGNFKRSNVLSPRDMNYLIDRSLNNNCCVMASSIQWINWKLILSDFLCVLVNLRIPNLHLF